MGAVPPREPIYHLCVLFFFFLFLLYCFFPTVGKCLLGSKDAESSSSGQGRPGRVAVFNFNCLGEDKTAACMCVCLLGTFELSPSALGPGGVLGGGISPHTPPDGSVKQPLCGMGLPPWRAVLPEPRTEGLMRGQVGTIKENHK